MKAEKKKKKTIIIIILCLVLISSILIGIVPIFYNPLLAPRMVEYYSNDENYVELEGEIKEKGDLIIILLIKSSEDSLFDSYYTQNTTIGFRFCKEYTFIDNLNNGDTIKFTSASRYFYDGYQLPIVSLEVNDIVYLTFEEGKAGLLEWAREVV